MRKVTVEFHFAKSLRVYLADVTRMRRLRPTAAQTAAWVALRSTAAPSSTATASSTPTTKATATTAVATTLAATAAIAFAVEGVTTDETDRGLQRIRLARRARFGSRRTASRGAAARTESTTAAPKTASAR
jgi:hypothetical protein